MVQDSLAERSRNPSVPQYRCRQLVTSHPVSTPLSVTRHDCSRSGGNGLCTASVRIHYFQRADMPPGSVGSAQLKRGGPLPGYFQAVELFGS